MTVGRIFTKYISSQNHRVLELKNKGRTLLSSSRLELLEYSEQLLMCYAVRLVWIYGNKKLANCLHFKCTFCILGIFSKTGKTRVSHRVKMMTLWPGRERWPKWPIDPVTRWPSSMSVTDLYFLLVPISFRCPRLNLLISFCRTHDLDLYTDRHIDHTLPSVAVACSYVMNAMKAKKVVWRKTYSYGDGQQIKFIC